MKTRKGQMTLGDAPGIVLIVGLVFLVMATMALVGTEYGNAVASTRDVTSVVNESLAPTDSGTYVAKATVCGFTDFSLDTVYENSTSSIVINQGNYSSNAAGLIINLTSEFTDYPWRINYDYVGGGVSCNVTASLNTELANNTSIAGIILTISLVGIVLTILVGVFLTIKTRRL